MGSFGASFVTGAPAKYLSPRYSGCGLQQKRLCSRLALRSVRHSQARLPVHMSVSPIDEDRTWDVVIIGSGFGGLCCAAITTALGFETLVLESHYAPGGVAHGFEVKNAAGIFKFDTGPSFYCGLEDSGGERSVNPVKLALDAVGESVECVSYGKTGFVIDDLRNGTTIRVCESEEETLESIRAVAGSDGAEQVKKFNTGWFIGDD